MEVKGEIFHENVYSLWNVMDAPKTNKATNTPFFKKLNRIHNLLKRKNIMKRELSKEHALMDCIQLLIILTYKYKISEDKDEKSLILSVFSILKSWIKERFWKYNEAQEQSSFKILSLHHQKQSWYSYIREYCKICKPMAEFNAPTENLQKIPSRISNIHSVLTTQGETEINQLVNLFYEENTNSFHCAEPKKIIKQNIHNLIYAMIQYPHYFTILHFYFFIAFTKNRKFLLDNHSSIPASNTQFCPTLFFTQEERMLFSEDHYVDLFNKIAKIFHDRPNSIWNRINIHAEPNFLRLYFLVSLYNRNCDENHIFDCYDINHGFQETPLDAENLNMMAIDLASDDSYADISHSYDEYNHMRLYSQGKTSEFNQAKSDNTILNILYQLRHQKLSRSKKDELMNCLQKEPGYKLALWIKRVLEPRTRLTLECGVEPTSHVKKAIENLYLALQELNDTCSTGLGMVEAIEYFEKIKKTEGLNIARKELLQILPHNFQGIPVPSADHPELQLKYQYDYIYEYLKVRGYNLSGIGFFTEIGSKSHKPIAYNSNYNMLAKDILYFSETIEQHRELLYPLWFKEQRTNPQKHTILTAEQRMAILQLQESIIQWNWETSDYIQLMQVYHDPLAFINWIKKELRLQATNDINRTKSFKYIVLENMDKFKSLTSYFAAAAFYQMISNLIYFMREEMLSLL